MGAGGGRISLGLLCAYSRDRSSLGGWRVLSSTRNSCGRFVYSECTKECQRLRPELPLLAELVKDVNIIHDSVDPRAEDEAPFVAPVDIKTYEVTLRVTQGTIVTFVLKPVNIVLRSVQVIEDGYHLPVEVLFCWARNRLLFYFDDIACFAAGCIVEGEECIT